MDSKIVTRLVDQFSSWRDLDSSPYRRKEINQIVASIKQRDLTVLLGCRGTGKSTALRYAANWLVQSGVHKERVGYIDLEHPAIFSGDLQKKMESLILASLDIGKKEKKYIFIDEIGRLTNWQNWVFELTKKYNVSVAVANSGSFESPINKMAGAFNTIRVFPFSLIEYISLSTDKVVDNMNSEEILKKYISYGGLPVAIGSKNPYDKLIELFYTTIFFDILSCNEIRDSKILTYLAVDLISKPSHSVSATKIKGTVTKSIDQARSFLEYLNGSGLIHLVKRIEDQGRPSQASRRCFPIDTGLCLAVSNQEIDTKDLEEVVVFNSLVKMGFDVWVWRFGNDFGLMVESGNQRIMVHLADDVSKTLLRKLTHAMEKYKCSHSVVLVKSEIQKEQRVSTGTISIVPFWSWLIQPRISNLSNDIKVDITNSVESVKIKQLVVPTGPTTSPSSIPRHLL